MSESSHVVTPSSVPVEKPAVEAHAVPVNHEVAQNNAEVTKASNSWLDKTGNKVKRWLGHGVRFVGSELSVYFGTGVATLGVVGSILTANPLPLFLTAGGGALAAGGVAAEWDSMKHAKSDTEKKVFWLAKAGQTVGTAAAATLGVLSGPAYPAVATGMYLAGVGMGARAMAHRK